jgi:hypothetical protein
MKWDAAAARNPMYALGGNKELGSNPLWEHLEGQHSTRKFIRTTTWQNGKVWGVSEPPTPETRTGDVVALLGGSLPQASGGV